MRPPASNSVEFGKMKIPSMSPGASVTFAIPVTSFTVAVMLPFPMVFCAVKFVMLILFGENVPMLLFHLGD